MRRGDWSPREHPRSHLQTFHIYINAWYDLCDKRNMRSGLTRGMCSCCLLARVALFLRAIGVFFPHTLNIPCVSQIHYPLVSSTPLQSKHQNHPFSLSLATPATSKCPRSHWHCKYLHILSPVASSYTLRRLPLVFAHPII